MRTDADNGGGGKKLAKTCEHLLCMTPKENLYCVVNFLRDSWTFNFTLFG